MDFFEQFREKLNYTNIDVIREIDRPYKKKGVVLTEQGRGGFSYQLSPFSAIGFVDPRMQFRLRTVVESLGIENVWIASVNTEQQMYPRRGFGSSILLAADRALKEIGMIDRNLRLNPRLLINESDGAVTWNTYLGKAEEVLYREDNAAIFFP